jgi:hypothetical protein
MFVASRGRGYVIAIVAGLSLLICDSLTAQYFKDSNYYAQHGWPKLTAFWFAAAVIQLMLPRKREKVLGEIHAPPAEKSSLLRAQDALFLIPAKYWPLILFALGIGFYFVNF